MPVLPYAHMYVRGYLSIYTMPFCSDDKMLTGNVFDEVPTHQKDALDEIFIYFSENEPEISSEHLKLQSGARYSLKEGNTWHAVPKLGDFTLAFLNGSTNDDSWRNFAKF